MSGKVVGWAFEKGKELSPSQLLVLVAIADNSDDYGEAWPSRNRIVEKTRLGRSTVYRSIDELRDKGLLEFGYRDGGTKCFRLAVSQNGTSSHGGKETSHSGTSKSQGGNALIENRQKNRQEKHPPTPKGGEAVRDIYEFWQKHHDKPQHQLTDKRRRKVQQRLKEPCTLSAPYSPERVRELKEAIYGCRYSPHHMGTKADSSRPYNDLETILRDRDQVDAFRALFQQHRGETKDRVDVNARRKQVRKAQGLE